MLNLEGLEKQMIDCLSSDARLLNDLVATKKLAELMKQFDETVERWVQGINQRAGRTGKIAKINSLSSLDKENVAIKLSQLMKFSKKVASIVHCVVGKVS